VITAIDHVVIAVEDLGRAIAEYETLLGRTGTRTSAREGVARATIDAGNIAVELMAPVGGGSERLRAALQDGEGLKSLVFAVDDIEHMHRRCERVALAPESISATSSFRVNTERTHGVRVFFSVQRARAPAPGPGNGVVGLDHIVIRSPEPERAAALYGARLGLDMRLDHELMGRRLMFFRCGDAIVEVAHVCSLERDNLWGLSWRVCDAAAERERLAGAGLDASEVRAGMKPGTRVFTVRDRTCGVPTLMIEAAPKAG
jgi:catechol 2,3-dioxygenase-like lactoylglutathione lyase family enzyme